MFQLSKKKKHIYDIANWQIECFILDKDKQKSRQGRPQDFGLGGAKSFARSAKKKIRAKREKF